MCANHICTTLTPTNNQDHPLASLAFAHSCCFVLVNAASSKVFVRFAYPGLLSSASDNAVFVVGLFQAYRTISSKDHTRNTKQTVGELNREENRGERN